uniref:ABC transporter domain-containing protein n=1 Tax=Dendroctonus ponderosae TaxID=77166 RepID=A0AAR5Q068_DENPD
MHNSGITIPKGSNLTEWMIALNGTSEKIPFIYMRRFPNAEWKEDVLLTPLKSFVSIIVMLSFVYTCINTVKVITTEKEKQLKEAMKIMGLPNWLHWIAWFLKTFSYLMISIILMVVLLKVRWYTNTEYTVFTYANPIVLLIFLFFYVCATITFCFAVSVFFSKANTAATIAGLAWFLSYAPYSFMQNNYDTLSLSAKLVASLGSNTAMAFGFQVILMYEGTGEGVQFNNIWKPNTPDDDLSLGLLMVVLTVDALIYLLVALYIEAVFPGEYGVPQKWYFPFTATFWCGQPRHSGVESFEEAAVKNEAEFFETDPQNLSAGIKIRKLRKVFGTKAAVRNLSLNMYQDQITVLLGHNGAGKTTTMSMLTGMFTPTSGTAIVNGYDIRSEMEGVRRSLGLCPQHNIIFDDLTVAEHLYFFSKLKGMTSKWEIESEITKYVDLLELQPKRNCKSNTLSGGMKRKLCVGVALCGNSKVVMLDEPTAGMDPSARRALWDLLLRQKTGRTLLLSTHFMDEADLLGDRIAIMAGGELQCCGSSFFLKKKYGAGYHLVMDKSPQCDPEKVTTLLRKYISNIEVHSCIGSELTYLLAESQSYIFETMLRELEQHSYHLGINSYGISLTTLEEVFMKVGADHGQEEIYNAKSDEKELNGNAPTAVDIIEFKSPTPTTSSLVLLQNQITAMSLKKILSTMRSWVLLLIQIFMPVIFLAIAIVVARQQNNVGNLPALLLDTT